MPALIVSQVVAARLAVLVKDFYFGFWDEDAGAFPAEETASAFSRGSLAISGLIGLLLGIAGTTLVSKKKHL